MIFLKNKYISFVFIFLFSVISITIYNSNDAYTDQWYYCIPAWILCDFNDDYVVWGDRKATDDLPEEN